MKATIERATLLKSLGHVQSVVERRNTIPILANVLIEATPEGVSFRATDLDTEVVDRAVAQVERPGATTVSAVMLNEIARKPTATKAFSSAKSDPRIIMHYFLHTQS